jgi:hypothetical protein
MVLHPFLGLIWERYKVGMKNIPPHSSGYFVEIFFCRVIYKLSKTVIQPGSLQGQSVPGPIFAIVETRSGLQKMRVRELR